jgi:ankyrin repeat protein
MFGVGTVDGESNIIRLVHYTTQEYFQRTQERWFPNAELEITTICVSYLSFTVFESGFCETNRDFKERLRLNPLYDYAAHNWGHHAHEAPNLCEEVIDFLESDAKVEASSQAMMALVAVKSYYRRHSQKVPRKMRGLHLAACFGLEAATNALLSRGHGPELTDSSGRTALLYAARKGHDAVVKLLMNSGANIDSKDAKWCRTPLSYAAENGHSAIVQLLLDKRADIESRDSCYNSTPILWAAWRGQEDAVKLLLKNGAEPEPRNFFNSTPLSLAEESGNVAIMKLLLETGKVNVDSKDNYGRTPLSYAAESGYETIVQLLFNTGKVDINSKDEMYGRTPLSWAVTLGPIWKRGLGPGYLKYRTCFHSFQ